MKKAAVRIELHFGLHGRVAHQLTLLANVFTSSVYLEDAGHCVSARSILELMSLGAAHGRRIAILVDGIDEERALAWFVQALSEGEETLASTVHAALEERERSP